MDISDLSEQLSTLEIKEKNRYVVVSIDIGVCNLGISVSFVTREFLLEEVIWIDLIDITKYTHKRVSKEQCKLHHTRTFSDWIDHFFQENEDFFKEADYILLERQCPQGFTVVEQLIFNRWRNKSHLINPVSMHKFLGISYLTYDERKIETTKIGSSLITNPILREQLTYYQRKHDICDSLCIMLYWLRKKSKEYYVKQRQDYVDTVDFNKTEMSNWFGQFKYNK